MDNEKTRKRVNDIVAQREVLFQELQEIRIDCSHDSYRIGNWSWRPGTVDRVRICNHCDDNIGAPSKDEFKTFKI